MQNLIMFFCIVFIQTKKNEQTKQNKTVVKFMKGFSLPVGMLHSKSYQFHSAHASFLPIMLILALSRVILEKCQNINFWIYSELVYMQN